MLFILLILLFILYKQYTVKNLVGNSILTKVSIVNTYCTERLTKNNYSYFEFEYKNKLYKQSVNKKRCPIISSKKEIELYYYLKQDKFYMPEIVNSDYYKKYIIVVTIILILGLIPYKLFLK